MKYKYYFRKPKSEIVKDILYWLAVSGAVCIAATSPYFGINLMRGVKKWLKYRKTYAKKRITDTFKRLERQGCIEIERRGHQIYIRLTEKGKKMAGWLQIDALKINRPKKWDKKWRIVIFDISQLKKFYREAFRGKLKELGFYPLQKSVWIFPFDCRDEIELLREFFGLSQKEMRLIVAQDIGPDDWLKRNFKI
jgi:DNA-binding PadR family transcriptional regulator